MLRIQQTGRPILPDVAKCAARADKALRTGKLEAALDGYLALLELDPGNLGARHSAADVHLALHQPEKAADLLSDLLRTYCAQPDSAKAALAYRRLVRLRQPLPEEALLFSRTCERTDPREALAACELALGLYGDSASEEAQIELLERLSRLDPKSDRIRQLAERLLQLDRRREAAEVYARLGCKLRGRGTDAAQAFADAYSLEPQNPVAALGHGRALAEAGRFAEALRVLRPLVAGPAFVPNPHPSDPKFAGGPVAAGAPAKTLLPEAEQQEARRLYGMSLLHAGNTRAAEPYLWELFERDARAHLGTMVDLIGRTLDAGRESHAIELAQRLAACRQSGLERELVVLMKRMCEARQPGKLFLRYLAEFYDSVRHEADLCATLAKLFDRSFEQQDYDSAVAALEWAIDVDLYEAGHQARLEKLRGKLDRSRLSTISSRLDSIERSPERTRAKPLPDQSELDDASPNVLEDLLLRAELCCRFSLPVQALETVERIQRLFPAEQESNSRLRDLCRELGLPIAAGSARLLKRSSYIEVLLKNVTQARERGTPLSLLLLEFQVPDGSEVAERMAEQVCRGLRASDIVFRYGARQIAVMLGVSQARARMVLERLRAAVSGAVGSVAEARMETEDDPADIVTEWINRVEELLTQAKASLAPAAD